MTDRSAAKPRVVTTVTGVPPDLANRAAASPSARILVAQGHEAAYLKGRIAQVFDAPNDKRPRWTITDAHAVRAVLAATHDTSTERPS